ncbi:MAG: type II secretion system minor pseudopilin GspK [Candidatus Competibacteraceae bacterium]
MRLSRRFALRPVVADRPAQRGVALITVLLIVFMASVAAASLMTLQGYTLHRSTLLLNQQQARLYTLGAEQWAIALLKRDLRNDLEQNERVDTLQEDWATIPPSFPVQGGSITGRIEDLQGRFNLNNLLRTKKQPGADKNANSNKSNLPGAKSNKNKEQSSGLNSDSPLGEKEQNTEEKQNADKEAQDVDKEEQDADEQEDQGDEKKGTDKASTERKTINKKQLQVLQRLLDLLELDPAIADAIADWIDPDKDKRDNGAEDGDYEGLDPPYVAANQPLTSVTELRLIKGIDAAVYNKLAPYVCVLPPGTALNVNTASPVVLAALNEDLNIEQFKKSAEEAKEHYKDINEFIEATKLAGRTGPMLNLAVSTQHFLIEAEANVGEGRAVLHSVVERSEDGKIKVLFRSFGNEY